MSDQAPAAPAKVGIVTQVSYGLGSFASGISLTIMAGGLLQIYFNQVLGLPAVWVGAVIMASIRCVSRKTCRGFSYEVSKRR